MLVCVFCASNRRHVQSGLVRERRGPDIRSLGVEWTIQNLSNVIADRRETRQTTLRETRVSHLQLEIRDHGGEVGVSRALAETVQRALHVTHPCTHRCHGVGNRTTSVVVAMDSESRVGADVRTDGCDDVVHFVWQRSTVRVTHDEMRRAVHDRSFGHLQREFRIAFVSVEEVFEVDEHAPTVSVEELHRVTDHCDAFLERRLQRRRDVIVP